MSPDRERQTREIDAICTRTGLSLEELAERAAISMETMRKISKGYTDASEMLMQSLRNVESYEMLARGKKGLEPVLRIREGGGPFWGGEEAPVISWASAGNPRVFVDQGLSVERIRTPSNDPNTYVIRVEGESMEPYYRKGDYIVVSPRLEPQNGDLIVAKTKEEEVLFKLYHRTGRNGEHVRLSSYHPAYPVMEYHLKDFFFIHPVHSVIRKLKN